MKVSQLFPKKARPARLRPGGMTQAQAEAITAEFIALFKPVWQQATVYFRGFEVNDNKRSWILPSVEDYTDVPVEKMVYVLKYRDWFLAEVKKAITDDVPWL